MDFAGSVEGFWKFVALRQEAHWAHAAGAPKVSFRDQILASGHFPNVFRELDRGTWYFQEKLLKDRDGSTEYEAGDLSIALWRSLSYRPINRQQTFEDHGWPEPGEGAIFARKLNSKMVCNSYPVFTSRHLTCGIASYLDLMSTLDTRNIKWIAAIVGRARSLEEVYWAIRENLPGMGPFFSWQVTCDLLESGVLPYREDDWVKLGPGAVRGLQLIHCRSIRSGEQLPLAKKLRDSQEDYLPQLDFVFPAHPTKFTLKNIEHALCEYGRYVAEDWKR